MVGNFREGFFLLSPCKQTNCVSIRPTSNYLAAQTPTEACQRVCLDGYCSSHPGKSKHYVSTYARDGQQRKPESGSNCCYKCPNPGYEATFLATLEQRVKIAIFH